MDRWACVDLPAFPLQLLLRRRPELRGRPVALVDRDVHHAPVRLLSRAARRAGVRLGTKAPAACALCPGLEVALVPSAEIERGVEEVATLLRRYSPRVEVLAPSLGSPAATAAPPPSDAAASLAVLLDPTGLERLFGATQTWATRIAADLAARELHACVALATSRLAALVLARAPRHLPAGTAAVPAAAPGAATHDSRRTTHDAPGDRRRPAGLVVELPPDEEQRVVRALPLSLLALPAEPAAALGRLGVDTIGAFLDLPAGGLVRRFGAELGRLRRALLGADPLPLQPRTPVPSYDVTVDVEPPDHDAHRLLFLVRSVLPGLLRRLAAAGQALAALRLTLLPRGHDRVATLPDGDEDGGVRHGDEDEGDARGRDRDRDRAAAGPGNEGDDDAGPGVTQRLEPAAPTLDDRLVSDLVRLHLDAVRLAEPVAVIVLRPEAVPASAEQLALFAGRARRDAEAVSRAVARIRAAYGPGSVVRARLAASHVPERSWRWEPATGFPPPPASGAGGARPPPADRPTVVRAVLPSPRRVATSRPLPAAGSGEGGGAPPRLPVEDAVPLAGPHLVEEGWWEAPVRRAYHYVATGPDEVLWLYHDRARDTWYLHGRL